MLPCSFKVGDALLLADKEYSVAQVMTGKLTLRGVNCGDMVVYPLNELLKEYAEGRLKFIDFSNANFSVGGNSVVPLDRVLNDFPKAVQQNALRRLKYLRAICPIGRLLVPRATLRT